MTTKTATTIQFDGQVQRLGERLIVRLPDEASQYLPSRGQVAVEAVLNGHRFSTVIEPDGRKGHWIAVTDDLRDALDLADGSPVTAELAPTKEWPEPDLPADFTSALDNAPDISETWSSITPMARWEWVRWVGATANPDTRERRIEVSVGKLRKGNRRPCCFDLSSCTDPELSKSGKLIDFA